MNSESARTYPRFPKKKPFNTLYIINVATSVRVYLKRLNEVAQEGFDGRNPAQRVDRQASLTTWPHPHPHPPSSPFNIFTTAQAVSDYYLSPHHQKSRRQFRTLECLYLSPDQPGPSAQVAKLLACSPLLSVWHSQESRYLG